MSTVSGPFSLERHSADHRPKLDLPLAVESQHTAFGVESVLFTGTHGHASAMPTGAIKPGAIGTRTVIMPRPAAQSLSRTPRGAARSTGS